MYQVGEVIFYPMHGAGVVEGIEEKEILGQNQLYYILNIPHRNVQIMIPKDKAAECGMRPVVDEEILEKVLSNFYEGNTNPDIYNNQRFCMSTNKNKIKSGDIYQGTEIIRDLMRKSKILKLCPEDKTMLETARQILISEVVQVKRIREEEAENLLDKILEQEEVVSIS